MKTRDADRRGAALVELALALPVLLLLVGGAIDFSRFVYHYVSVSNAAGAAARFASFHPVSTSSQSRWSALTQQAAQDDLQGMLGYDATKATIPVPTLITETTGLKLRRVQVQVTYAFSTIVPWPGIPQSTNISRTVVMRIVR